MQESRELASWAGIIPIQSPITPTAGPVAVRFQREYRVYYAYSARLSA
jgi:hypothetical protein